MDTNLSLGPKGDRHFQHGSYMYNLGKVLNFTSRHKKLLKLVKVLEKYLISLLGLEKSLKFTTLSIPDTIFCKISCFFFARENLAHPLINIMGNIKIFLRMNNILFLFLYFECYFCTSDAIVSHLQVLL